MSRDAEEKEQRELAGSFRPPEHLHPYTPTMALHSAYQSADILKYYPHGPRSTAEEDSEEIKANSVPIEQMTYFYTKHNEDMISKKSIDFRGGSTDSVIASSKAMLHRLYPYGYMPSCSILFSYVQISLKVLGGSCFNKKDGMMLRIASYVTPTHANLLSDRIHENLREGGGTKGYILKAYINDTVGAQNEINALNHLDSRDNHNIIRIFYDSGEMDLKQEYSNQTRTERAVKVREILLQYAGESLFNKNEGRKMKNKPPMIFTKILKIFHQILQALQFMESRKSVHIDIKPQNIGITKGKIKIFDLGSARPYHCFHEKATIKRISLEYSPWFSCKEIVQKSDCDPDKIDCYSLGRTMFYLLEGFTKDELPLIRSQSYDELYSYMEKKLRENEILMGEGVRGRQFIELLLDMMKTKYVERITCTEALRRYNSIFTEREGTRENVEMRGQDEPMVSPRLTQDSQLM